MNKLGDPDRKVASRSMYRLQLLLKSHAAMANTVVKFCQAFLGRPNLSPRGVYNGVIFLNQVRRMLISMGAKKKMAAKERERV
jgi:ribosome biogenesis protein MAK21